MKKTKILFILLCIAAIVIFWNLKDKKLVLAPQSGKLASSIKPLTKEELNSEALGLQESFVRVAERLKPAVVNISAVQTIKYEVPQQRYEFFFGDPFEDFFREFGEQYGKRPQPKKEYKKYRAEGTGINDNEHNEFCRGDIVYTGYTPTFMDKIKSRGLNFNYNDENLG